MNIFKKVTLVTAAFLTIVINIMANALPFNNLTTAQISDSFRVYFVPAGYVFAIWGLIYLGMISFVIFIVTRKSLELLNKVYIWFLVSCLANSLWIVAWHYKLIPFTVILMILLLFSLIKVYLSLNINLNKSLLKERLFLTSPISIYLAWICVATIANVTILLYSWEFSGLGIAGQVWSVMLMLIALILSVLVIVIRKDRVFPFVVIWALFGIAYKFQNESIILISGISFAIVLLGITIAEIVKSSVKVKKV